MKIKILTLIAACAFAGSAPAFVTILPKQPAKPQAAARADVQDLVFCSEQGLYKLRLHVSVNGRSASANWGDFVNKAFDYSDRNRDGFLDAKEIATMIPPYAFSQGVNFIFNGRQQQIRLADLDTNKDGKVDRAEFANFFRRGMGAVQVNVQPPNVQAERLTDALYKHLGAKNGKLTKADLAAAWERLQKLDADEDEILTAQELLQRQANPFYAAQVVEFDYAYGNRPQMPRQSASFVALTPGEPANASAAKVLQVLQSARVPYLALTAIRTNSRVPGFVRTALQKLDAGTLAAWLELPPDLELEVQIGFISEGIGKLLGNRNDSGVRVKPTGRDAALEKATAVGPDGRLRLTTPSEMVEFVRAPSAGGFDQMQYYRQQYKTEAEAKLYMDKQQIQQSPQLQFLSNIFEMADRDGDGKLFVAEFNAFLDLLKAGSNCQVSVQVLDQGRGLFDLIDANHDQRLSRRELLDAAKNFAKFDRNGDGFLERGELPRQLRLTTSQGNNNQFVGYVIDESGSMMPGGARQAPAKGPLWFRKMDRNQDGDVSMREFLGTPEEFKKIDADGDGLISAAEAEAYQKQLDAAKSAKK
jgi:Ca2+-binding EF-hand superfamily protein